MTRNELKLKVLQCVDEVSGESASNIGLDYPIDSFLDEAGRQILMIAPISSLSCCVDYSADANVDVAADATTGSVSLPKDFLRLVSFKMKGWMCPVVRFYHKDSAVYRRQFLPYMRAGIARPVVVLDSDRAYYFSVQEGPEHVVEDMRCVCFREVEDNFPERLSVALAWLTASKTLQVLGDIQESALALEQFNRAMACI